MKALPWRQWPALLRSGDYLVVASALAFSVVSARLLWQGGAPASAVIRAGGSIVAEVALSHSRRLEIEGPLGITVIEIEPGRARVSADPGPRQYCVRQGWLDHAGAVAICAPNQVSISLLGSGEQYDSLSY